MNPPTIGHQKLVRKLLDIAKQQNCKAELYLSHTEDKKNILSYEEKLDFIGRMIPETKDCLVTSDIKNPHKLLLKYVDEGYTDIFFVVGPDRFRSFSKTIHQYKTNIHLINVGDRNQDLDSVEGASSTKMKKTVEIGSWLRFSQLLPDGTPDQVGKELFTLISNRLEGYKNYTPISGSFGVPRSKMPQIRAHKYDKFVEYLNNGGIPIRMESIPVDGLIPTQNGLNTENVKKKIKELKKGYKYKPLIVSKDNYILDGHHTWAAASTLNKSAKIPCISVGLNIKNLLDLCKTISIVEYEELP